jgi:Tol biopolymer transport system component
VPEAGGAVSHLTRAEGPQETLDSHPWFLPDGRHFLYHRNTREAESTGIYLGSLDTTAAKRGSQFLVATGSEPFASYAPSADLRSGYLLFLRDGSLMAQPFDPDTQQLSGEAVPVVDGLGSGALGNRPFSLSTTGVLAYRTDAQARTDLRQLTWFDREGKPQETVGEPGDIGTVSLSPDGTRVAVDRRDSGGARGARGTANLLVYELGRNIPMQITFSSGTNGAPVWSPNSDRIVFGSSRDNPTNDGGRGRGGLLTNLYHRPPSGAGVDELLLTSNEPKYPLAWSPDGQFLLYSNGRTREIWKLRLDMKNTGGIGVNGKEEPYLTTTGIDQVQFSPDGSLVVYSMTANGPPDVYVQTFPDASKGKWKVSEAGGRQPRWRGKEIFYLSLENKMMAVEVSTSPMFQILSRKTLFSALSAPVARLGGPANVYVYDVTADGKKFLINSTATPAPNGAPPPITVILNWQSLLKR